MARSSQPVAERRVRGQTNAYPWTIFSAIQVTDLILANNWSKYEPRVARSLENLIALCGFATDFAPRSSVLGLKLPDFLVT